MQCATDILLIKPAGFSFNAETALTNTFQQSMDASPQQIQQNAAKEFDAFAHALINKGIQVMVIDDTPYPPKPDAIFPNNWVSCHSDGTMVLCPMCTPNRRLERRPEIIDAIKDKYVVEKIIDLSAYEASNQFLEGTGSIVFDHLHRIAYACLSPRTNKFLLEKLCGGINYTPVYFFARNKDGKEIYHTNVMMCIAERFAVVCLESISDEEERSKYAAGSPVPVTR